MKRIFHVHIGQQHQSPISTINLCTVSNWFDQWNIDILTVSISNIHLRHTSGYFDPLLAFWRQSFTVQWCLFIHSSAVVCSEVNNARNGQKSSDIDPQTASEGKWKEAKYMEMLDVQSKLVKSSSTDSKRTGYEIQRTFTSCHTLTSTSYIFHDKSA